MKYLILIILLIHSFFAHTQVNGKVINIENASPVEYANISLQNTTVGVMANSEGEFILKIPKEHYGKNIIVSCMGFVPDTIKIPYPKYKIEVYLRKDIFQLEEITIKPVDPLKILRNAIKRILNNYFVSPTYLSAYYRETVNTDSAFVKYTDAACQIYYCGYNTPYDKAIASKSFFQIDFSTWNKTSPFPQASFLMPHPNDAVKIIEARKSNNLESFANKWGFEESLKRFDIGGGPLHITSSDIVKFKKAVLDTATWKYYSFQYAGILKDKNRRIHKIKFSPKGKGKIAIWQGHIYIDEESGAFVEFHFSISPKHLKYIAAEVEQTVKLKRRERRHLKKTFVRRLTKSTNQQVNIKYTQYEDKWYLSYIRIENTYLNKGNVFDDINYKTFIELYVNGIETLNVIPFKKEEEFNTIQSNYLFQSNFKYTPEFWETYNFPVPNKLFKNALQDLEKDQSLDNQFRKNSKVSNHQ